VKIVLEFCVAKYSGAFYHPRWPAKDGAGNFGISHSIKGRTNDMFAKLFSRGRSASTRVPAPRFALLEPLESRSLLSVSSMGIGLTDQQVSPFPTGQIAETTRASFVALAGRTYSGSYTGTQGTASLSITFVTFTHTGHFTGTFVADLPVVGSQGGTFAGRVTTTRHLFVTVTGTGFSGDLTAYATHTGKIITGTYNLSGVVTDSGSFTINR